MDDQEDQQANNAPVINIKNEPISDGIEFENNPWNVESLQAFLCLKCPQCVFDTKEKDSFQNHAIKNHPLSIVFFGSTLKEEFNLENKFLLNKRNSDDPLEYEPDYLDYCESKLEEFDCEYTEYNDNTNKIKQERKHKVPNHDILEYAQNLHTEQTKAFTETKREGHFFKDLLSDPLDTNVKGGDAESDMVCDICNKRFISKKAYTLHVFQKHRDACNICFKNFPSKQHLEAHITTAHTLLDFRKKYRCGICDISFSKNESRLEKPSKLIKHMKSEHNIGKDILRYGRNTRPNLIL